MIHHHDDLTLSPVEQGLWLDIEASMAESDSRFSRLRKWQDRPILRRLHRHRIALAWLGFVAGMTLTVGTFTGHLVVATVGVAIQAVSLHNLLQPIPKSLASALQRVRKAGDSAGRIK